MGRPLRLEITVDGDTPEDLVAALDDALRKFVEVAEGARPELSDANDVTMESSPHPLAGWRWRWYEDLNAYDPAAAAMAAHTAAGGAVRRRPPAGG